MVASDIDEFALSLAQQATQNKEQYLLRVFGSYEKAQEVAHLYVFEESEFVFVPDEDAMSIRYSFRVRPKTSEELEEWKILHGTQPKEEHDIHEWLARGLNYTQEVVCTCGYQPHNQEDMDEHNNPTEFSMASEDSV